MSVRQLALGLGLLAVWYPGEAAFAAPPGAAAATPAASTTPDPCAAALPDLPNDMPTAFAYELVSPGILQFITRLANVPEKRQKQLFETVVGVAGTPGQLAVRTALDGYCANLDEVYGETRALSLVVNHWTLRDRTDSKRFDAFAGVVGYEISALSLGDKLPADVQNAAAAPFASLATMPEPTAAPSGQPLPARSPAGDACAETDARLVHYVEPTFPATALAMALSGTVNVKLALNADGRVESARVYSDTLKQRTGSEDLIRQTIFAAAASTYAPATIDCKPVPSTFIFSEDFSVVRG